MSNEPLPSEIAQVVHEASQQILRAVLAQSPLPEAFYHAQNPESQAWRESLPEAAKFWLAGTIYNLIHDCEKIESQLTFITSQLLSALTRYSRYLSCEGFQLQDNTLIYNDQQARLNHCHAAITSKISSSGDKTPDELLASLVTIAHQACYHDVFLTALHAERKYLVRKYRVAWFNRLEAEAITVPPPPALS
jgi:hypothetical protein